jgi:hypothetical protein
VKHKPVAQNPVLDVLLAVDVLDDLLDGAQCFGLMREAAAPSHASLLRVHASLQNGPFAVYTLQPEEHRTSKMDFMVTILLSSIASSTYARQRQEHEM